MKPVRELELLQTKGGKLFVKVRIVYFENQPLGVDKKVIKFADLKLFRTLKTLSRALLFWRV